jgi:hypothetical protein
MKGGNWGFGFGPDFWGFGSHKGGRRRRVWFESGDMK